ncbi:hypothetical protein [Rhizobium sp. MHM7A]|uniref:hypothetical protein n=1 Tax=Rhizobium sp. MHM7A TaxID=2583233 RepID=UPI0011066DA2|nr:hypothetical protein [Rhizobium sp. MHM7A]TLX16268.1 hypothetical protein FFR93_02770 [Rhizobium sp. MHM7A]
MQNEIASFVEDDEEPTIVIREDQYCPICECYNGHSLSCATFRFNRIEGDASKAASPPLLLEVSAITNNDETVTMVTVSDANVREAIDDLERQTGVQLSFEQMQGLLVRSEVDQLIEDLGEVETQVRETLADALATELVGRDWPMNQEQIDKRAFIKQVHDAAVAAGYRVPSREN